MKLLPNGSGVIEARSSGSVDGTLQLNCSVNSHGVKLRSPSHSAGQSYTMVLPDNQIAADKFLKVKSISGSGSTATGQLEFADASSVGGATGVDFNDNVKARFGTSNDLQLYHDATFNQIESHNDKEIHINAFTGGAAENMAKFKPNGVVELFHNASKKFSTQSFGADIYGQLQIAGHCTPSANNTYDLGTTSERWRNIYTNDLNLSNEGSSNDVDGTWGNYTIQEGAEDLFLINKRNGKKYKFNLTEVS